jgi:hypothetical protein
MLVRRLVESCASPPHDPCFEAIDRPRHSNVCLRRKSGSSNQTQLGPVMTYSGHFVVRTLREEYGPNFADAVGGLSELDLAAIFRDGMNG